MRWLVLVLLLIPCLGLSCESSESSAKEERLVSTPTVQGVPFDDVVLLAAGLDETCVVVDSGATYCAGGDRGGYNKEISLALPISESEQATQVSIGESACAAQKSGQVVCWGKARNPVLPRAEPGKEFGPAVIPGLPPASYVLTTQAAFPYWVFSRTDGSAWQWGGTSFDTAFVAPKKVEGFALREPVQVESNNNFYCARLRSGSVTCWDMQGYVNDQLNLSIKELPPSRPANAIDIAVSYRSLGAPQVACALDAGGRAECWRYTGESLTSALPYQHPFVTDTRRWKDIALAAEHGCGVEQSGSVWCVGRNRYGQLGAAEPRESSQLIKVPGVAKAIGIAVGHDHSCALLSDRSVVCWGSNSRGECGAPGRADRVAPTPFLRFTGSAASP